MLFDIKHSHVGPETEDMDTVETWIEFDDGSILPLATPYVHNLKDTIERMNAQLCTLVAEALVTKHKARPGALTKIIAKIEETFPDATWLLRNDDRQGYFANIIVGKDTPMVTIDRDGRQSIKTSNRYYTTSHKSKELALLLSYSAAVAGERALTEAGKAFVEGEARG